MKDTFYISVDSDGNMPVLTRYPATPVKPYWTYYQGDVPVRVCPHPGQDRLWNYKLSRMEALRPGVLCFSGKGELPVTKAQILEVPHG